MENNIEGRSLAWGLGHPGLFAYGRDGSEALANFPAAALKYCSWIAGHGGRPPFEMQDIEPRLDEVWNCYSVSEEYRRVPDNTPDSYEVNAWFLQDWKPLAKAEIDRGLHLLAWSRADLLGIVQDLDDRQLNEKRPGERWSIAGILGHIGGAEWWYLDRLDLAFPRAGLPGDIFERLGLVRARLVEILPRLAGSRQVVGIEAELWSPRKLLRRAVWHELDHLEHIRKLIGM
jgi:hypothetical protein